mmetsp:Transcript_11530/g.29178  ORF Transcript_11530/g.29178 Transcript_11530/m.29178 type:complete len:247 (-) Transcript_11530:469-1209(-)
MTKAEKIHRINGRRCVFSIVGLNILLSVTVDETFPLLGRSRKSVNQQNGWIVAVVVFSGRKGQVSHQMLALPSPIVHGATFTRVTAFVLIVDIFHGFFLTSGRRWFAQFLETQGSFCKQVEPFSPFDDIRQASFAAATPQRIVGWEEASMIVIAFEGFALVEKRPRGCHACSISCSIHNVSRADCSKIQGRRKGSGGTLSKREGLLRGSGFDNPCNRGCVHALATGTLVGGIGCDKMSIREGIVSH